MKTLLVLAPHPELPEAIRSALDPQQYRVTHRVSFEEAEPLLHADRLDACIVDAELSQVQAIWLIEKLRRQVPKCPLLVYAGSKNWDWEEDAYVQGVNYVLTKPVRGRLLNALLERFWTAPPAISTPVPARATAVRPEPREPARVREPAHTYHALQILRDFSAILTHSLQADAKSIVIGILRGQPRPAFGLCYGLASRFIGAFRIVLRGWHRRIPAPPRTHSAARERRSAGRPCSAKGI